MKSGFILGITILIAIILVAGFYWVNSVKKPVPISVRSNIPSLPAPVINQIPPETDSGDLVQPRMFKSKHYPPITPEEKAMWKWYTETRARDHFADWKTPIEFYGIVIDQDNNALPGADVNWITTNMHGNGRGTTISGPDGRFFIGNTQGNSIDISVRKKGYRPVETQQDFDVAKFFEDDFYVPDKDHPVVFHLRKLPTSEPYYGWSGQSGKINNLGGRISINGITGEMSPGETSNGMWIQFVPAPQNQWDHQQYGIMIGTSSGVGVILRAPSSDPVAPDTGYQNPLNTNVVIDSQGPRFINVSAFFKDGSGNYGTVNLDIQLLNIQPSGNEVHMSYDIKYNPHGGKVLMFDRTSQINNPDSIHSSNH
jgi:hypothetical protein